MFVQPSREVPLSLKSQQYSLKDREIIRRRSESSFVYLCLLFLKSRQPNDAPWFGVRVSIAPHSRLLYFLSFSFVVHFSEHDPHENKGCRLGCRTIRSLS